MNLHELIAELREPGTSKIVLVVADGLGGLPLEAGGKTELESARTPHLDACARDGVCGLSIPVLPGITPGSGPGHLGLFGYDPLEYRIGRGILEALGFIFRWDREMWQRGAISVPSMAMDSLSIAVPAGQRRSAASPCVKSSRRLRFLVSRSSSNQCAS